jgi:hypothetical protein
LNQAHALLVRNVEQARRLVLRSSLCQGSQLTLPANATPALVRSVQRSGRQFLFGELDANLALLAPPDVVAWAQPAGAEVQILACPHTGPLVVDYGHLPPRAGGLLCGDVTIFALHAAPEEQAAGALVLAARGAADELQALLPAADRFDHQHAAAYARHWRRIAVRQQHHLAQTAAGLQAAAGLRLAAEVGIDPGAALGDAVLVHIPDEVPAVAFHAYAAAENTPVAWLPYMRPIHHLALAHGCASATARRLERWLAVPVAPGDDEAGIAQAVLGVVKTAEYLGVRWRTDPARAAAYAALLEARYGPGHDAYRPIFAATSPSAATACSATAGPVLPDLVPPNCKLSHKGGTHVTA